MAFSVKKRNVFVFLLLLYPWRVSAVQKEPLTLNSPNGNVHLIVEAKAGKLTYAVSFKNTVVLEPSTMGLMVNGSKFGNGVRLGKSDKYTINESYATLGVHSMAVNKCNGLKISIDADKQSFVLDARAYNDGVAFRYLVPNKGDAVIDKDTTQFKIVAGSTVWSQPNVKAYEAGMVKRLLQISRPATSSGRP